MKRISLLLLVLATACTGPQADNTANEAVVRSMFEAFNKHDWKAMADHYSDSALFLDPSFGKDYVKQSHAEMIAKYTEMQSMFPDIHDELVGIYTFEDKVTVEFVSTGTSTDGRAFKLPIGCILTLHEGKIVRDATYYDL